MLGVPLPLHIPSVSSSTGDARIVYSVHGAAAGCFHARSAAPPDPLVETHGAQMFSEWREEALEASSVQFLTCVSDMSVALLLLCIISHFLSDQWVFPQTANPTSTNTTTILIIITIIIASLPASFLTQLAQTVCNCTEI